VSRRSRAEGHKGRIVGFAKSNPDPEQQVGICPETETERNVGYDERLGFRKVEQVAAVELDLPIWVMIRRSGTPAG
jgi:hypothetical protein